MNKRLSVPSMVENLSSQFCKRKKSNSQAIAQENVTLRQQCSALNDRVKELEKIAKEREAFYSDVQRIRAEHHMAEQIQRGMLPRIDSQLNEQFSIDLYADMDTAWEIGGDYFDFFALDENRLFFCVADVSGKSVSAAMFSMVVKTFIKAALLNGESLEKACYQASRQLFQCQTGEIKMFVTLWAGILYQNTHVVEFINAGHEPPLIVTNGSEIRFCDVVSGLPIAAYYNPKKPEKSEYHSGSLTLHSGDILLLYTDGVSECANKEGARMGRERLKEVVSNGMKTIGTMQELVCYVQRHVITYANHSEQDDDITLLALKQLK